MFLYVITSKFLLFDLEDYIQYVPLVNHIRRYREMVF